MSMFRKSLCISWDLVNELQWHGCELDLKVFCITFSGNNGLACLVSCGADYLHFPSGSPDALALIAMKTQHYMTGLDSKAN